MANPIRGEVDLVAGGETYRLRLSINAIIEVETLLDVTIMQVADMFSSLQTVKAGNLRAVLWAALQENHPDIDLLGAGDIMALVGLPVIAAKLGESLQAAFPKPEGKKSPSPARGPRGTGKASSSPTRHSRKTPRNSGG